MKGICLWKEILSQQRIRHFKILQSIYFAYDVRIISSYSNRIICYDNSRRAETHLQIHSQYVQTQALVSMKVIFQFIVFYYESSPNKLKATPNAVNLAIDLLLSRPENTGVNQP